MKHYDTIIVGAGLAGLQCARLLGRAGLTVLLVDRKESLETSIHTTGIFVRRTLEDFDIPAHCLGPVIRDVTLYSPARRTLELRSPEAEFRIGRMGPLYADYLEDCLRAGVDWLPRTRYEGWSRSRGRMEIGLAVGRSSRTVSTRYLVGGDGAKSRVALDLNLDLNQEWIIGVEDVLAGVPLQGAPRLHCFLDASIAPGYLAWVAHDGEETHVGVGGYASMFDPVVALNRFRSSLNDIFDFSAAREIERRGGRIPVGGVLKRIANVDGLLLGDAAGAVSPLTAGGLDPCMRLSTLAARVIPRYLETGDADALHSYSGELFRARFTSRLWMRRLISNVREPALIELGCAAMRLPLFKSVARQVFFGRGSFPDIEPAWTPRNAV